MWAADHSSKRSDGSRRSDESSVDRTEVLSRIEDLIAVIRPQEISVTERFRTIPSRMDELGSGYKINISGDGSSPRLRTMRDENVRQSHRSVRMPAAES